METVSLYRKDYEVDVSHVDFSQRLKLSSLFIYFQDLAVLHAENLGIGMKSMLEKHNAIWVLARMRVDINRYPVWGEKITIETWPHKPNKIEFMRDFLVKDYEGNILVRAVSTWVVIDVDSRSLKKADSVFDDSILFIEDRAIDCKLGKLKAKGNLELVYKRKVGYSDIDVNEHLNNAKYVDFIMDSFSLKEHKKYDIKSIEINYSNEALPGDTITIYKDLSKIDSNLIYMEGINEEDNKLIFKSQIRIEHKDN